MAELGFEAVDRPANLADTLGIVQLVSDNTERTSLDRAQQLAHLIADRMAARTSTAAAASL